MVYKTLKKTFILNELQIIRNSNYIANYQTNFKRKRRLCLYTKRGRAVLSVTRSSRHCFKEFARKGLLYGVKRYSW